MDTTNSGYYKQGRIGCIVEIGHPAFERSQRQPVLAGKVKQVSVL